MNEMRSFYESLLVLGGMVAIGTVLGIIFR